MNADVEKAVERAVRHTDFGRPLLAADLQTIRQALRDQEAEIAGLRADLSDADERAAMRSRERTEAVMRAEKADSLLRECLQHHGVMLLSDPPQDAWKYHRMNERIDAHLSENEHELS